jgi:Leucine Rich repeat
LQRRQELLWSINGEGTLWIKGCTFENEEVLRLMCDFFDSNKAPKTLESVNCFCGLTEQIYESLLPSLHNYKTITELFLWLGEENDSGISGELVGNLLQRNTTLTRLRLGGRFVTVEFIRAMRKGLLASRSRLQSLRLHNAQLGHEALDELRLVYENNHGQESVILRELDLSGNAIEGRDGGDHLRRLLLTLPGLTTLDISKNEIDEQSATALFADGMTDVLGRLQRLCMRGCVIGNVGLTQMAASVPGNALLVDLDLSGRISKTMAARQSLPLVPLLCHAGKSQSV